MLYTLRNQATISTKIEFGGIGVHSGLCAKLSVLPAPENTGLIFIRTDIHDKNNVIELKQQNVVEPIMCTKIINSDGISVSVIEHLAAAFRIAGITNALIEIDTEEVPIMDGSAAVFLREFSKHIIKQSKKVKSVVIQSDINIKSDKGFISAIPSMDQIIDVSLNYDRINRVIGTNNRVVFSLKNKTKLKSIAYARTFGWLEDCERIRAMGMARGTSLENTVVITPQNYIMNSDGLRNKREIVYHKALDLIGDFTLSGYDIIGAIRGSNTSHLQNNLFIKKLMSEINLHSVVQNDDELQYVLRHNNHAGKAYARMVF